MPKRFLIAVCILSGLVGPTWADTVVLRDGTRLSGDVRVGRDRVTVRSRNGILTLPSWRVVQVMGPQEAAVPQPAPQAVSPPAVGSEVPKAVAAPGPTPGPAARRPGPPAVAEVLARNMTVNFDGVPVQEVMEYIRELTGVNMALAADVRTAPVPVYLNVRDVPLSTILEEALEPNDLACTIRPGEILYVGRRGTLKPAMRIYQATDLLLSVEDRIGGIGQTLGGGSQSQRSSTQSGATDSDRSGPQYSSGNPGAQLSAGGAQGRGGAGSAGFSTLSARAENLILLIKNACGAGTWADAYSSGLIDTAGGRLPAATNAAFVSPVPY